MKAEDVYWDKPDLAADLRVMADNLFPGIAHCLQHAVLCSAAKRIERQAAEIARLQSGGCARDQSTTQYCAEAAAFAAEVAELRAEVERLRNPWRPISDCPEDEGVLIATTGDHVGCGFWVAHRDDPDVREWYWSGAGCQRMHPNLKPLGWKPLPAGLSAPLPGEPSNA